MRTDSHTHSPNEADKISARVARLPHPTSIAWMLGPPGPQPDSSWRDSSMAYRRKPSAFGISVGGGAAMSRNAPTAAACRSFYTWARSSLARSVGRPAHQCLGGGGDGPAEAQAAARIPIHILHASLQDMSLFLTSSRLCPRFL